MIVCVILCVLSCGECVCDVLYDVACDGDECYGVFDGVGSGVVDTTNQM